MFTSVLPSARAQISPAELEKLLEWWAATLSRVAEALTGSARKEAYLAMLAAVRDELDRNPLSRPATYWTVVVQARDGRSGRRLERGGGRLDSRRLSTGREGVSRRSRPLRHADAHSRTCPVTHGSAPRLEGDDERNRGDERRVACNCGAMVRRPGAIRWGCHTPIAETFCDKSAVRPRAILNRSSQSTALIPARMKGVVRRDFTLATNTLI